MATMQDYVIKVHISTTDENDMLNTIALIGEGIDVQTLMGERVDLSDDFILQGVVVTRGILTPDDIAQDKDILNG